MNPLTKAATFDRRKQQRADLAISVGCGIVFALLNLAFFLKG